MYSRQWQDKFGIPQPKTSLRKEIEKSSTYLRHQLCPTSYQQEGHIVSSSWTAPHKMFSVVQPLQDALVSSSFGQQQLPQPTPWGPQNQPQKICRMVQNAERLRNPSFHLQEWEDQLTRLPTRLSRTLPCGMAWYRDQLHKNNLSISLCFAKTFSLSADV